MLDIILENIPTIITAVIGIGIVWKYGSKATKLLKEVAELLMVVVAALEDKKITKEELDAIIKEAKDISPAVKNIFKRKE